MVSDPVAHGELVELHKPTKLRPLGRPAIVVRQYRCRLCNTNWLLEFDPLQTGATEWLCLNGSSNILAPSSAPQPNDVATGRSGAAAIAPQPNDVATGRSGAAAIAHTASPQKSARYDEGSAIFYRATADKA
ncbi:hypothetical protein K8353_31050 [Burkholderia contaminans]|nr:hypothetical protein [Burkholderia contaminans]